MFRRWPESFILHGGANLVLFQESVRHSADLDLHLRSDLPPAAQVADVLREGLEPLAKLLEQHPLGVNVLRPGQDLIGVSSPAGGVLFTIDLNRMGSVIQSGIEEQLLEGLGTRDTANVKFVSRDHLLLQKAEAFLLRRFVKARDAYDIRFLLDSGARLNGHLRDHLADLLLGDIDREQINERIASVTDDLCRAELKGFLPKARYEALEKEHFQSLKDGLSELFGEWL
ncbi:MAG TPA: nucleotidyl transferase AbiEii/AbiGii toxin family protein [Candidatus Acidoferrales bacterium]|nr:nucleotidyl transferase AbiEii/AbiGii toxin family protein [Candidatus Acidoferrales bacterium]